MVYETMVIISCTKTMIITILILIIFCAVLINGANVKSSSSIGTKGQWQLLLHNSGVVSMHMALTNRNTVIMFDQTGAGQSGYKLRKRYNGTRCTTSHNDLVDPTCYAHSVEYDIAANKVRPLRLDTDTWCSSGSFLSNGTLLQTGGYGNGAKSIRFCRPCGGGGGKNLTCGWIQSKKTLLEERRYASSQILAEHDRVVVVGGRNVFTYEFVPKINHEEKSFALPFLHQTNDKNSGGNNLYPFLHLSSDGNLFIFANRDSILLNARRNRVIKTFPRIPGHGSRNYPSSGSSVMLPLHHKDKFQKVEVMVCGGSTTGAFRAANKGMFLEGLRSCGRMVITGNHHKWNMEYMPQPRLLHDLLILPTGQILIINGAKHGCAGFDNARNASLEPYLYNPKKILGKRFKVLKSTSIARMFHSSAILLPDGRVLVGGGNPHSRYIFHNVAYPTELRLQAFVPHYMDKRYHSKRPMNLTIEYGNQIGYGKEFRVKFMVVKKGQISNNTVTFSAYAPPFTTHAFGMNQRMLKLRCKRMVVSKNGSVNAILEAPPSSFVAPSGYYLFTVVNAGIPSISQWIRFTHNDNSSSNYVVLFDGLKIETIITHKASIVEEWIQQISSKEDMIIGLDTEWTKDKNNKTKVAILQLCVEDKCLIFQFFFNNIVPQCLRSFLMDLNFKFVGVGIENDIKRLKSDYGLECKNAIDLATFAGEKCDQNYSSRGLKFLAKELVGLDMKKSKDICTSEWKSKELTKDQIEYACIDAYASYKIGHYLLVQKEEVYPKPI